MFVEREMQAYALRRKRTHGDKGNVIRARVDPDKSVPITFVIAVSSCKMIPCKRVFKLRRNEHTYNAPPVSNIAFTNVKVA